MHIPHSSKDYRQHYLSTNFRHLHAENPEVQEQVNLENLPKIIFHIRGGYKKRTPHMTNKDYTNYT